MTAYYNEYDPFAAATLRELIADGLIAPGVVDDRSIELVQPSDLKGSTQVHLFAGFGVWSLAARLAGWRDDRPLWSASCPCPPFSTAGKVKACPSCNRLKPIPHVRRTGVFLCSLCGHEWLADGRHLWPEVWRLVRDERPACIVGEQVASADGRTWLDLVRASLEIVAYDAWGVDTCAAGFGAPHIRQRLYWVADTHSDGHGQHRGSVEGKTGEGQARLGERERVRTDFADGISIGLVAYATGGRQPGQSGLGKAQGQRIAECGSSCSLDDADSARCDREVEGAKGNSRDQERMRLPSSGCRQNRHDRPGPTNGLWRDPDWLRCTDDRWRPVESGTFPLANAGTFRNRVAELRGAGNAVNLAQATEFIRAIMPELPGA